MGFNSGFKGLITKTYRQKNNSSRDEDRERRTAGYTRTDYKTNTQIAKELKITSILEKITGIQEKLDTTCK